jgi:hypothetical protein
MKHFRNPQRILAVLAALAVHLVVLAVLSGAAHAHGERLRDAELRGVVHTVHERSGSRRTALIDLTPPEVTSLGRLDLEEHPFDLPEPLGVFAAFATWLVDEPEPAHMGCGGPVQQQRGRAPPRAGDLHVI